MIESLCYAVVGLGAVVALLLCLIVSQSASLRALAAERDRLRRQILSLRKSRDLTLQSARSVNAQLDQLAACLAGELLQRGAGGAE